MISLLTQTFRNPDLAVDLGTAQARVSTSRSTSFFERPARVGSRRPLTGGAVVDASLAAEVLAPMFRRVQRPGLRQSRILACAPSDASEKERELLVSAVRAAGGSAVYVTSKPLASAIGAGADVGTEEVTMVVDLGEGVTDCAVLAEGQILASAAVRGGCSAFRAELRTTLLQETGFDISDEECDRLLQHIGLPGLQNARGMILAMAIEPGHVIPRKQPLPRPLIAAAIERRLSSVLEPIAGFTRGLDAEMLAALGDNPVYLTGGGALIPGVSERVALALRLPVRTAEAPHHAVIRGARAMLETAAFADTWHES